jgi:hypothetical protein
VHRCAHRRTPRSRRFSWGLESVGAARIASAASSGPLVSSRSPAPTAAPKTQPVAPAGPKPAAAPTAAAAPKSSPPSAAPPAADIAEELPPLAADDVTPATSFLHTKRARFTIQRYEYVAKVRVRSHACGAGGALRTRGTRAGWHTRLVISAGTAPDLRCPRDRVTASCATGGGRAHGGEDACLRGTQNGQALHCAHARRLQA